jgi:glutamate-5-semialdehyde dehydrogenase
MDPRDVADSAAAALQQTGIATTERKNGALECMAKALEARKADVVAANESDMARAKDKGLDESIVKRLRFGEAKVDSRIASLRKIASLPDPVGQTISTLRCANGLDAKRVRVPLGVILMVYEARPHVTVNAGAFCLKAGNACILRGGSEARECNALLGSLWRESAEAAGLPGDSVQVISGSHEEVGELLSLEGRIDLVIPRGGKGLIEAVARQSRVPVLKHFAGVCHVFVGETAPLADAVSVAIDSKCLMPEVCNAMETLLVHKSRAGDLPAIVEAFTKHGVTVRGCPVTRQASPQVEAATEEDWTTEYLDMIVSVRVVDDVDQAISHINAYGSHHTDSIVTDSASAARRFTNEVDSGVVLVNASTMFCDGETLGMGAEIGISTDKLHARGPMGLQELTSYKFVIEGVGQTMGDF